MMKLFLTVHATWLLIHACLVANDRINPWKLGGYAMYTVPAPCASVRVLQSDEHGFFEDIQLKGISLTEEAEDGFRKDLIIGCISRPSEGYQALLRTYPSYPGLRLRIDFMSRRLSKSVAHAPYYLIGFSQLIWEHDGIVSVDETLCGRTRSFRLFDSHQDGRR